MKTDDLRKRVQLHNGLQWFLGIGLIPVSLALWVISFFLIRFLFALPLNVLGLDGWAIATYIAVVFIIALAIEGVRYGKPLFEVTTYTNSMFYDNFVMNSESGRALNWYYHSPSGAAFLLAQFFFCAPRSAVHAVTALRSRLPTQGAVIEKAARILQYLKQERKWVRVGEFPDSIDALYLLRMLHLIWIDETDSELLVRYPAGKQ